jgi:hypothetical protein
MSPGLRAFRRLRSLVAGFKEPTDEARLGKRRSASRSCLSRPAMIILESGDRLFARSRDISTGGIGLSHGRALPLGPMKMNVDMGGEGYMQIRAKILWCRQLCEKSYISGGEFLAPPAMHAPAWSDEPVVRSADESP